MNLKNISKKSQELISDTVYFTASKKNSEVTEYHLLYKLLEDNDIKKTISKEQIVKLNKITIQEIEKLPILANIDIENQYFSKNFSLSISIANEEIKKLKIKEVMPIHLLLALFKVDNTKKLLLKADIKKSDILSKLDTVDEENNTLSKFTIDLTKLAMNGELDPIIGRDDEIRRLMQILSRRTKNNPMVIGEAGVGKTAVIEGLAKRIVDKDVPTSLLDKKVLSLDLGLLVAGAKYKGEFEERLKNIIKEVEDSNGDIILFIDEIHMLMGAGGGGNDSMDAANLLKPSLARGKLKCIGATTLKEYKFIEKDKALERRFQTIHLKEPTIEEAITILRGISHKYELFHGIKISDKAIIAAVKLSNRYISGRKLPDKAIDLIDETASTMRIEAESMPIEIDIINRNLISLKVEKEALLKDKIIDTPKLDNINLKLEKLELEYNELNNKWSEEKLLLQKVKDKKNILENCNIELEKMQRLRNYNKVAELQYGEIPKLEAELKSLALQQAHQASIIEGKKYNKDFVDENDVAIILSKSTGIPVSEMLEKDRNKILKLESYLKKQIIGQEGAISSVSNAIKRNRAGLNDFDKPISTFLFLGPTGVGKTELSKVLARYIFDDVKNMIRVDMSEYMEKHTVSKLIGSPPGYIGHEAGGFLTESLKQNPYSIILFDEIEKAHPDVLNIMLQIFDDGILTDSLGETVNFKNTIIIMTSNAKSEILKSYFKPEFLNRIDDIIIFNMLNKEAIEQIFINHIEILNNMLKEKGITVKLKQKAIDYFCEKGFKPEFGARPLKRVIESDIKNILADLILEDKLVSGKEIVFDVLDGVIDYSITMDS